MVQYLPQLVMGKFWRTLSLNHSHIIENIKLSPQLIISMLFLIAKKIK